MSYSLKGYIWGSAATAVNPGFTPTHGQSYIYNPSNMGLIKDSFKYADIFDDPIFNMFLNSCAKTANEVENYSILEVAAYQDYILGSVVRDNNKISVFNKAVTKSQNYDANNLIPIYRPITSGADGFYGLPMQATVSEHQNKVNDYKICYLKDVLNHALPKATADIDGVIRLASPQDIKMNSSECAIKDLSQVDSIIDTKIAASSLKISDTAGSSVTLSYLPDRIYNINTKNLFTINIHESSFAAEKNVVYVYNFIHQTGKTLTVSAAAGIKILMEAVPNSTTDGKIGSTATIAPADSTGIIPVLYTLNLIYYEQEIAGTKTDKRMAFISYSKNITIT